MKTFFSVAVVTLVMIVSCKKKSDPAPSGPVYTNPTVTTSPITNITSTSAVGGGTVVTEGGIDVTIRGVAWSSVPNQIFGQSFQSLDGHGLGTYTSNITGLSPHTTYYVKSYAANGNSLYGFGAEVVFTTP